MPKSQTWQPVSQSHSSDNCMRNNWTKATVMKGRCQEGIYHTSLVLPSLLLPVFLGIHTTAHFTPIRIAAVRQIHSLQDQGWILINECSKSDNARCAVATGTLPLQREIHQAPASTQRATEGSGYSNIPVAGHSVSQVLALVWTLSLPYPWLMMLTISTEGELGG